MFLKFKKHLKIQGTIRATRNNLYTWDPKTLGATAKNLLARANCEPQFESPWSKHMSFNYFVIFNRKLNVPQLTRFLHYF
jgi:hypothetical protein